MSARIELTRLLAIDSGERVAEPHLWTVFFKVDGSTFATVLAQKLERGRVTREELDHRGIGRVERAGPDRSSFFVPGNAAGALEPMSSGDAQDLTLGWEAELDGGRVLHGDDVTVGCFVLGWEIDNGRAAKSDERYAAFADDVRRRVLGAVSDAIDTQRAGSGPYRFPMRSGPYLRQVDAHRRQVDAVRGVFAGQDHEVALVGTWGGGVGGGLDPDDLLGALVVAAAPATLADGATEGKRLWIPTAESGEGTWELGFRVRR
jgi:hypothetical protein